MHDKYNTNNFNEHDINKHTNKRDINTDELKDYINRRKQEIELINKRRDWLIKEVVSRGLYDFELRDSGIEWLGEIPTHWELLKAEDMFNPYPKYYEYVKKVVANANFTDDSSTLADDSNTLADDELLPSPRLFEQKEIAEWLDRKCAEFDAMIESLKYEIKLVEELIERETGRTKN